MMLLVGPELITIYNEAAGALIGAQDADAMGRPLAAFWPEWSHAEERIYPRVRAGESVIVDDPAFPAAAAVGARSFSLAHTPVRDDDGAVVGALVTIVENADGAERSHTSPTVEGRRSRHEFLLDVTDRLETLHDRREIMRTGSQLLARYLSVAAVSYTYIEPDSDAAHLVVGCRDELLPVPPESPRFRLSDAIPRALQKLRRGHELFVDDLDPEERRVFAGAAQAFDVRAAMVVPIMNRGKLVAILSSGDPSPRAWSHEERLLHREVADRTWRAVERANAEAALRVSEEKMRLAAQAATMFFWAVDVQKNGARLSARDAEVIASSPSWRASQSPKRHPRIAPEDIERVSQALAKTMRGEGDLHLEYRLRHPETGEPIWVESHGTRVIEPNTLVVRVIGITQNVDQRKRLEDALRESEDSQAYLLSLSDALRPLEDAAAIQRTAVRHLAEHLRASRAQYIEYVGDTRAMVVRGEYVRGDAPSAAGAYHIDDFADVIDVLRAKRAVVVKDCLTIPDLPPESRERLEAREIRAVVCVPLLKSGELVAALAVMDSSPRGWKPLHVSLIEETAQRMWGAIEGAHAREAMQRSLLEATAARAAGERANKAKDEFLATLSHELRTPLAAILLWGGALKSARVPPKDLGRAIDAIVHSAESQSRLIEDLLDLSRLTAGKLSLAPARVRVDTVVRAALDIVGPMAQAKGVELKLEVDTAVGTAYLDPARIKQVLWNLLSNAIKFTPEKGTVSLQVEKTPTDLEIRVVDTGEGIAADFMPHLFERFQQADMGETRMHAGLGIGLALTRHLVELHGGSVYAESDGPGQGATFFVLLPNEAVQPSPSDGLEPSEIAHTCELEGLHVLLVEDDAQTREAMDWTLSRAGAKVLPAGSGAEALALIEHVGGRSPKPDVIVCDLGLPGMTGYEFIELATQRYLERGLSPLPACAVSAHVRDADRKRAIDAGFDIYLAKPVAPEQLIEAVDVLRSTAQSRSR